MRNRHGCRPALRTASDHPGDPGCRESADGDQPLGLQHSHRRLQVRIASCEERRPVFHPQLVGRDIASAGIEEGQGAVVEYEVCGEECF